MRSTYRGRPRLDLQLVDILESVRRHGKVTRAARELGCSDSYIHVRFKSTGISLTQVLEATDLDSIVFRSSKRGVMVSTNDETPPWEHS
jgi:AraC-like DNA-binding protein